MTDPITPEPLSNEQRGTLATSLADSVLIRLLKEIRDPETKPGPLVAASLDLLRALNFNWQQFTSSRASARASDDLPTFDDQHLPDGVTLSCTPLPAQIQSAIEATAEQRAALTTPFLPKI